MAQELLKCNENCEHQKGGRCHIKCQEGEDANECRACKCTICEKKSEFTYESKAKVVKIAYEAGVTVEYKGKYYKENYREERVFDGEDVDIDIDTERQMLVDAVHDVVDKAVVEALEAQKA